MSMIWIFGLGYLCSVCIGVHARSHTLWRIATGRIADDELVQVRESEEDAGNSADDGRRLHPLAARRHGARHADRVRACWSARSR